LTSPSISMKGTGDTLRFAFGSLSDDMVVANTTESVDTASHPIAAGAAQGERQRWPDI
jgi:hypothetical protein